MMNQRLVGGFGGAVVAMGAVIVVVAGSGCGGAPAKPAAAPVSAETITSTTMMGNTKVTKGTAEVTVEGMDPVEVSFEEDDLITDTDPNADDQSFTITDMKSGTTSSVGIDTMMGRATFKQGAAMVQLAVAADGTLLWNGMPIAPADVEAKVKAEPALVQATPGIALMTMQRLGDGSFATSKDCKSWNDPTPDAACGASRALAFFLGAWSIVWDWGYFPSEKCTHWSGNDTCTFPVVASQARWHTGLGYTYGYCAILPGAFPSRCLSQ